MFTSLHVIQESFKQAAQQLYGNKLRSFLSLLGITIGIFCIIAVKSAVNSLEDDVRKSLSQLGNDVLYITKMPWNEDPEQNFWKYQRRPAPTYEDYQWLSSKLTQAQFVAFSYFIGSYPLKWERNSLENTFTIGVTLDYGAIYNIKVSNGRYFTQSEYDQAASVAIIGAIVAERLFGAVDPVGRDFMMKGRRMRVIGVIEKKGESVINVANYDEGVLIPFSLARSLTNTRNPNAFNSFIGIKVGKDNDIKALKDEIVMQLRSSRRLKPQMDNNFAINEISMIQSLLDNVFSVLNLAGFVIGIFAILVGMFSVANIMFVSVKERTNIIGIKKALGARKYMILLEFLIESTILCLIGGILGLALVAIMMWLATYALEFNLYLSLFNAFTGVIMSAVVGILAGLIPAWQAANMDPVEAIRQS